ncbi:MAG: sulfite exporter TauE/SafE family protein [Candidatus Atribacteria bacterium]|nr:sulfite exporter TauE/SafE family protein [Candidatus Atribacteria bacterium]
MNLIGYVFAGLTAVAAGIINALAGGGTLITFPVLMAIGLPAVSANVTNTVALCPGYLGGTLAQSKDLKDQKKRLWILIPAGALGGLAGGILLLNTGEKLFTDLVPYLILVASTLLAVQNPVRAWLTRRLEQGNTKAVSEGWAFFPVFLAAIYGGYFGAGLSVIVLAVLGLVLNDSLTRLNAFKQGIAFATNVAAALFFVFSGKVVWNVALVMAVGALLGGVLGGKLASKIKPAALRWVVVTIGFVVGIIYLVRSFIA